MAGGPGVLEIEAAGDAVDVEEFADEVEVFVEAGGEGFWVDLFEGDAAAGDEFVFVGGFAGDVVAAVVDFGGEGVGGGFGELGVLGVFGDFGVGEEAGPEALGESGEGGVLSDLALGSFGASRADGFGGIGAGEPVDAEVEAVAEVVEVAGAPGGELEDCGAGESPVGDEKGAGGGELGAGDAGGGLGNGEALKAGDAAVVVDFEGEEGGDGGGEGVAEGGGKIGCGGGAGASGGEDEVGGVDGLAGGGGEGEAFFGGGDGFDSCAGASADSGGFGGSREAIDDGLGGIRGGEHPAVGFGLETGSMALEPCDGVFGPEVVKGTEEGFFASRVVFYEWLGLEAVVGDVAAATSGNFNFLENLASFFEEEDFCTGAGGFCCGDCSEVSGSAAADNDEILAFEEGGSHGKIIGSFPVRRLKIL